MGRRLLFILLLAWLIAGACAFFVYHLVNRKAQANAPKAMTRVVAASSDLPIGSIIAASDLTTIEVTGGAPRGAIDNVKAVVGRAVTENISKGEPILESRLASAGAGGGLASTIPAGMRAIAIKVDDVTGVSGFAAPGMWVDVVFTIEGFPGAEASNPAFISHGSALSRTVLQHIRVLSAGTDYQRDPQGKAKAVQVVNLLVTPEQAEVLAMAGANVNVRLVLRNPADEKIADVPASTLDRVFASGSGKLPAAAAANGSAPNPNAAVIAMLQSHLKNMPGAPGAAAADPNAAASAPRIPHGYAVHVINGSTEKITLLDEGEKH